MKFEQARVQLANILSSTTFFVARAIPLGLRAVLVFSLARSSDPITFSKIASALVVVETLRYAFDLGQDTLSIKLFSRAGLLWMSAIKPCLTIKVCAWVIGAGINFLLIRLLFIQDNPQVAALIAVVGVCPLLWNFPINLLQSRGLLKKNSGRIWIITAILFVFTILVMKAKSLSSIFLGYAAIEYTGLVALALIARKENLIPVSHWHSIQPLRVSQIKIYIQRGAVVVIGQMAALCYGKFDVLLIVNFGAPSTAAYYLFAQRILDLAGFLSGGASSVMYSTMARLTKADYLRWIELSKRWAVTFVTIAVLVGLAFWVAIPVIIKQFFGNIQGANQFVLLFGFVAVFAVANQYASGLLNSLGRFATIARLNIVNLFVLLSLGSISYITFGASGLISSIAVVYAASAAIQLYLLRKSIKIFRL